MPSGSWSHAAQHHRASNRPCSRSPTPFAASACRPRRSRSSRIVSGRWIEAEEATNPYYWAEQLRRRPVADGLADWRSITWSQAGRRTATTWPRRSGPCRRRGGVDSLLDASASCGSRRQSRLGGGARHDGGAARSRLPTYPFERPRYWIDPPDDEDPRARRRPSRSSSRGPADWLYSPGWKQTPATELVSRGRD